MQFATCVIYNMYNLQHVQCDLQHVQFATHAICNTCNLQHAILITCAISNICNLQHFHFLTHVNCNTIFMERQRGQIITCILERGEGTCKKSRAQAYTTVVVLVSNSFTWHTYKARKLTIMFFLHQMKCK